MRRFAVAVVSVGALVGGGAAGAQAAAGGAAVSAHTPIVARMRTGHATVGSANWSGYAAYGTTFTDVKGDWQQPGVDCSGVPRNKVSVAAFWVGLDGYMSNTVEQAGTQVACVGGTAQYLAWYEFYPARPGPWRSARATRCSRTTRCTSRCRSRR